MAATGRLAGAGFYSRLDDGDAGGGGGGGEEAFALGPSLLPIFLHSPPFESRNGNIWVEIGRAHV